MFKEYHRFKRTHITTKNPSGLAGFLVDNYPTVESCKERFEEGHHYEYLGTFSERYLLEDNSPLGPTLFIYKSTDKPGSPFVLKTSSAYGASEIFQSYSTVGGPVCFNQGLRIEKKFLQEILNSMDEGDSLLIASCGYNVDREIVNISNRCKIKLNEKV